MRSTSSSVVIVSPARGAAHDQLAAGHPVEVERVQWLAGEQHHVVGDVDDVVDRPLAGRGQPLLEPERRRADRDVGEHAGGEARAQLGHLDRHRGVVGDLAARPSAAASSTHGSAASSARGDRVHLARDPVDAEAVGAVRGDLELEHRLGDRQHARPAASRRAALIVEDHDAVGVGAEPASRPRKGSSRPTRLRAASPSPSFSPPGITAPGRATATVWPAATFGAPQTIVRGPSAPTSTSQTRSRSASGCGSTPSTRPTTKPSRPGAPT